MMYSSWDMKCNKQFFENEKNPVDIILHMCRINENYMMYGSWEIEYNRQRIFCHFRPFFALLTPPFPSPDRIFCHFGPFFALLPPNNPENRNFEKMKNCLKISSFHTSVSKIMIICYTVPEIWGATDIIFILHFGLFFALLHPLTAQKIKI